MPSIGLLCAQIAGLHCELSEANFRLPLHRYTSLQPHAVERHFVSIKKAAETVPSGPAGPSNRADFDSSPNGSCNAFASSHSARIQMSRSSSVVRNHRHGLGVRLGRQEAVDQMKHGDWL